MSIRKRKDTKGTSYQVRWTDPRTKKQKAKDFKRLDEAKQFDTLIKNSIIKSKYTDPHLAKTRIIDVYADWVITTNNLKPKTKESYKSLWKCLIEPVWGNVPLLELNRSEVKKWVSASKSITGKQISNSRMRQAYIVLNLIIDHAVDMALVATNVLKTGKRNKLKTILPLETKKNPRQSLTLNELFKLANAMGEYKTLILLAGLTGMRWAEIVALTPTDIDLKAKKISINKSLSEVNGNFYLVPPKNGKTRVLSIPDVILPELRQLALASSNDEPIFRSKKGKYLRHNNFYKRIFRTKANEIGIDGITFHELRHTAISQAISAGADILAVSKIAGHSNPAITLNIYAHELDDSPEVVTESINKKINIGGF